MNMRAVTVYLSIRSQGGVGVYMLTSMFCDAFHYAYISTVIDTWLGTMHIFLVE